MSQLFAALDAQGQIRFVGDVARGAACGCFCPVCASPLIAKLGYDPEVREAIKNKDFAGLMQLPQVEKVANHPDLQPILGGMQLEQAMDSVVYKQPPPPQPVRLN